ncbi:MAG TPA: DUF1697 domain-containing protein [Allosphingosinicella sp.]|nr:DUF1697 domain-containing protein [Allosphingosinicella sp.]
MAKRIALLRGINVGGRNKVPMAALREVCAGLGWREVATFIQSGNVVFEAKGTDQALEAALEEALAKRFDLRTAVIVRSAAEWAKTIAANPFPDESEGEPNRVLAGLSKRALATGAAEALAAKAAAGERVEQAGGALWFHYPNGAGQSKITPAMIDRAAGSPMTARNWRTMAALAGMAG